MFDQISRVYCYLCKLWYYLLQSFLNGIRHRSDTFCLSTPPWYIENVWTLAKIFSMSFLYYVLFWLKSKLYYNCCPSVLKCYSCSKLLWKEIFKTVFYSKKNFIITHVQTYDLLYQSEVICMNSWVFQLDMCIQMCIYYFYTNKYLDICIVKPGLLVAILNPHSWLYVD